MTPSVERLSAASILEELKTRQWRGPVWCYDTVTSTNDLAKDLGQQGAPEGAVIVADTQTAGRGRLGRRWLSPPGVGLYVSLLLRPNIPLVDLPKITLTAGVAVVRAIKRGTGIATGIKWPNDIILAGKKVGGILTEMFGGEASLGFVVVGLGLNVNNLHLPAEVAGLATSLAKETGRTFCRRRLVQGWLEEFEELYTSLLAHGFPPILRQWREYSVTLGHWVTVRHGVREIRGLALDVAPDGGLLVQTPTGEVECLISGEVIPNPPWAPGITDN